jgi:hypothetical protein
MGVSTDYTRVLRTDGSGHFIIFLTHSTVSYVQYAQRFHIMYGNTAQSAFQDIFCTLYSDLANSGTFTYIPAPPRNCHCLAV